ncbi:hypothetical protein [Adhaeretor mobilis]|uniref:PEP-CTERM protein-sorting domain-containing protein n=1 Tax=Adhaeretor mobilis TaxID=1930276 RepID=A0A517MQT2_9BACT|nr:hypothetical protein [Adhaeretor mobilis]QDS97234.1 hypothetical protein HG15A2_04950 [Adhaeretor mobilis]
MRNVFARYFVAVALCGLVPISTAQAGFDFVFTPAADGGVDVVGTGSGFSDRVDPLTDINDWDIQDFATNFMVIDNGATLGAASESGTLTNVTTSTTVNVISFSIDEDFGPDFDNDIDFDTDAPISFSLGDEMSFSFTGHFDPGTLQITDLVPGIHIDEGHTTGAGIAEESFGISTVTVIPEPNSLLLALACFTSVGVIRRRR